MTGCLDHGAAAPSSCVRGAVHLALANYQIDALDVLLVVDDSPAMRPHAAGVQRALVGMVDAIVHPRPGEGYRSVQIAVASADLGGVAPGCTADGDDARLDQRVCAGAGGPLPPFLWFDTEADEARWHVADVVCAADLGTAGCPTQQPLEAAYRALVERDVRATPDGVGFVRPDALLAIVVISPGDDASTSDPAASLDRYIDPRRPDRGFPALKPNRPENVVFGAATVVPSTLPMRRGYQVDWDALLAPADAPRRLLGVARRFAETSSNGFVTAIDGDLTALARPLVERIQTRLAGRCLPRALPLVPGVVCCDPAGLPAGCAVAPGCRDPGAVAVRCEVVESLAPAIADAWCTAAHGRRRLADRDGRAACRVDQLATRPGTTPPRGAHGYFYDTTPDPTNPGCDRRLSFTRGDTLHHGSLATIDCALDVTDGC